MYTVNDKIYFVTQKNERILKKYFYSLLTNKKISESFYCVLKSKLKVNYKKAQDITEILETIILDYKIDDNITFRVLRVYNIVRLSYNSNYDLDYLLDIIRVRLEKNHDIIVSNEEIKNIIEFKFYNQYDNLIK